MRKTIQPCRTAASLRVPMIWIYACSETTNSGKKHECLPLSLRTRLPRWQSLGWRSPVVPSSTISSLLHIHHWNAKTLTCLSYQRWLLQNNLAVNNFHSWPYWSKSSAMSISMKTCTAKHSNRSWMTYPLSGTAVLLFGVELAFAVGVDDFLSL